MYGFYDECIKKYGSASVWKTYCNLFEYLPITAIIDNQIFAIHGGLSPNLKTIEQIQNLDRFRDIPNFGLLCDLMWSDPGETNGFSENTRGVGCTFGQDVTKKFLKKNNMELILRAHQLQMEGYSIKHNKKLITIFSAPNYQSQLNNLGAFMKIDENLSYSFVQFRKK
ncbi:serine/threonine-protein phosphatase pp2a-related [Anaeramoeba flamelloides]|uniref:protein-serine/threonine phosphatase n=1 Tax=Anaeramoeba flamelloides TaxID=1746091 RepID=A0AAV7Z0Q3_9EUKA|nr:serine/threonine-protein phosphatase pp2a-related [Anaeramoeba flamelloides]